MTPINGTGWRKKGLLASGAYRVEQDPLTEQCSPPMRAPDVRTLLLQVERLSANVRLQQGRDGGQGLGHLLFTIALLTNLLGNCCVTCSFN